VTTDAFISAESAAATHIPNRPLSETVLPMTQEPNLSSNEFAGSILASSKSIVTKSSEATTTPPTVEWTDGETKPGHTIFSNGGSKAKGSWWHSFLLDGVKEQPRHPSQQIEVVLTTKKK
jgi:hypothetical protein